MKKQEFLDRLKSRIDILDDSEVEDIMMEYEGHILEKMNKGKSEEEAIQDFGDFNELIKDILSAYKIKDKPISKPQSKVVDWLQKAAYEINDFLKPLFSSAAKLKGKQVLYFLGYVALTLLLVYLIQYPLFLVKVAGRMLLSSIPFNIGYTFGGLFSFLLKVAHLGISIMILVLGIQRAIEAASEKKMVSYGITRKETKLVSEPVEDDISPVDITEELPKVKREPFLLPFIGKSFVLLFKVFVFLCLIPGVMFVTGLVAVLGMMIALLFRGVYFVGLFLIIVGLLMGSLTILDLIVKAVYKKGVAHA
jgi:uncharacterized membrane protein